MRALVVDDARVARKMVGQMVEGLGFEVSFAEDGAQALEVLASLDSLDAIVTDWNMPVMDGVEFARAVRKGAKFSHVPILMISSESDSRRVAKALLSGVDEYLFKPVDRDMIKARLEVMGVYSVEAS